VLVPLVHVAGPWWVSSLTTRHGWVAGRPGLWNLFGLVPVLAGFVGVIWSLIRHYARCPRVVELELTPPYLLNDGPYTFTRNPMYVSALAIWLGWTLFYGSVAVSVGLAVLWLVVTFLLVPSEERNLEARFGESYLRYKGEVPRWIGTRRRR
jgi:protein-S-isoprenylcysteine O-methyltransferase Ste14